MCWGAKKLDNLAYLLKRLRLKRYEIWRYPQIDASEQAGWNFIIARADGIDFPIDASSEDTTLAGFWAMRLP